MGQIWGGAAEVGFVGRCEAGEGRLLAGRGTSAAGGGLEPGVVRAVRRWGFHLNSAGLSRLPDPKDNHVLHVQRVAAYAEDFPGLDRE